MKFKHLLLLIAGSALILSSCGKKAVSGAKLKDYNDTLSYAFGVNIYYSLLQDSIDLNPLAIARAMVDAKNNKSFMSEDIARAFLYGYLSKKEEEQAARQDEVNKELFSSNIAKGDSFLQANRNKPGVIVTESGLQYKILKLGTGPKPDENDSVKVNYIGTFIDGTKFDSSYDRGEPAEFLVGNVIKGWVEGLQLMPEGSKFVLYIPPDLAYGAGGAGNVIQPFTTLVFEVELLQVKKQQ